MKIDTDGDDFDVDDAFERMKQKPRRGDHSAAGRRRREMRSPVRAFGELKEAQLNIRVAKSFRAKVPKWAKAARENLTNFVEKACLERAQRLGIIDDASAMYAETEGAAE